MKESRKIKRVYASENSKSKIVSLQVDVELAAGADIQPLIDAIYSTCNKIRNTEIVGADVIEDLTSTYEKYYPELFELKD